MEFTSWDACLRPDELEHHGIKGQKWGVRKYQNRDGSLTPLGEKRYGISGTGASARRMTKDFNKLDKSYANVEHRRRISENKVRREMHKANRGSNSQKRYEKHKEKALTAAKKASEANKQKKAIESLQWKIVGKAAKKGYTIGSEAVVRSGERGRTKVARMLGFGDHSTKVHGQNIRIKKYGGGQNKIVNYSQNAMRAAQEEERRRRLRAQLAGAYR